MGQRRVWILAAVVAAACLCWPQGDARAGARAVASASTTHMRTAGHPVRPAGHRKSVRRAVHRKKGTGLARASTRRSCRRRSHCRHRPALREAFAPEQAPLLTAPTDLPAPIVDQLPSLPVRDADADIVEREKDVAIILSVATTLRGYSVEHAVSIIEVYDRATGDITYRLVRGDTDKCTRDSAELAQVALAPNERLVADLHSHPLVRARVRDFTEMALARQATAANFYPGVDDYMAMTKRGVVSAIVDPDGGVLLLRRVRGAPSIRKIDGEPLQALDAREAARLDVSYLYAQGYLVDGAWTQPAVAFSLHAGP